MHMMSSHVFAIYVMKIKHMFFFKFFWVVQNITHVFGTVFGGTLGDDKKTLNEVEKIESTGMSKPCTPGQLSTFSFTATLQVCFHMLQTVFFFLRKTKNYKTWFECVFIPL